MNFKDSENWAILNSIELSIKNKIEKYGTKLSDWDLSINRGILTGYNDAFIIDETTKNTLVASDPKSAELIRPILRGKDIKRYTYDFAKLWIIFIPCGFTNENKKYGIEPEQWFKETYPSLYFYLIETEETLSKNRNNKSKGLFRRDDKGDYWWELRSCKYLDDFNKQKIIYPCIMSKQSSFMLDTLGKYFTVAPGNIITGSNLDYLISCLNSKIYYFALRKFYMGGGIEGELKTNRLLILPVITANCMNPESYKKIVDSEKIIQTYIDSKKSLENASEIIDLEIAKALDLTTFEYEYISHYMF